MHIVIDIVEEDYQNLEAKDAFDDMSLNYYERRILYGTPQPKTGHWIEVETLDSALWHECSECGEAEFRATDYCPNCGAKMQDVEKMNKWIAEFELEDGRK